MLASLLRKLGLMKPPEPPVYFGLDGLDRLLEKWLDFDGGVFIEAGANDGQTQSNTAYFEYRRGWTGLLVEPIPELAARCRINRPHSQVIEAALGSPDQQGQMVSMTYCNLMSLVDGALGDVAAQQAYIAQGFEAQPALAGQQAYQVTVPMATLSGLIDQAGLQRIDFLSLDVEGYEVNVLSGLDITRHRPRFILIEALFHADTITEKLAGAYECLGAIGRNDLLFRCKAATPPLQTP